MVKEKHKQAHENARKVKEEEVDLLRRAKKEWEIKYIIILFKCF